MVKDIEKRGIAGIRPFSPRSMIRRRLRLTTRLQQNTFGEHGVPINCHVAAIKRGRAVLLFQLVGTVPESCKFNMCI